MSNMKLIMESWRQYQVRETQFVFLLEGDRLVAYDLANESRLMRESNDPRRMERLFESWLTQTDAMLTEGVMDFLGKMKDKAMDLAGRAKESFMRFVENPYLELSLQLFSMIQNAKSVGMGLLKKVSGVADKINKARLQFKKSNPKLYAVLTVVVQVVAIFMAYYAIEALLGAGTAQAKVTGTPIGDLTVTGDDLQGVEFIVGFTKKAGHEGLAQEMAKMIQSPIDYDYSTLQPEMQKAITNGIEVMKGATEMVGKEGDPASKQQVLDLIKNLISTGESVFQDLMKNYRPGGMSPEELTKALQGMEGFGG